MRKKQVRFLGVFLVMLVASFFVPMTAMAETQHDLTQGDAIISTEAVCQGHIITGTDAMGVIKVTGGVHTITLEDVTINTEKLTDKCAFALAGDAQVTLTLKGTNTLTSTLGNAGIAVPRGTKLTITGDGTLNTKGGQGGAGIGGSGGSDAGSINIEKGVINATGGEGAAGIGGGVQGSGGNITISGGTVIAQGGNRGTNTGLRAAPGIGYGCRGSGGSVTITGGSVTAKGGSGTLTTNYGYSIAAATLSSSDSSANDIKATNGFDPDMDWGNFNGIVLTSDNKYMVYGEAVIDPANDEKWKDLPEKMNMEIPEGTSLSISNPTWTVFGTVTGGGKIFNRNNFTVSGGNIGDKLSIYPKSITSDMVQKTIPDQTYTGASIEPKITIMDGDDPLTEGDDYELSYEANEEVGTARINIKALGDHYQDATPNTPLTKTFEIIPADLSGTEVVIEPSTDQYDGEPQDPPSVTVKLGESTTLAQDTDYEIESYEPNDFTNAGDVTINIKAKGNNFEGTTTGTYTITPKPLDITGATADKREFNGTNEVKISNVELDGIVDVDDGNVKVDTSELTGKIEKADVGNYDKVTLSVKDLKLIDNAGNEVTNYTINANSDEITVELKSGVEISQLDHEKPVLSGKSVASMEYPGKFACRLTVDNAKPGATYRYRMLEDVTAGEATAWSLNGYFDNLEVNQDYTFVVEVIKNDNVNTLESPDNRDMVTIHIEKLEQDAPKAFQITFKANSDEQSYTASMPEFDNALYSFDGQVFLSAADGGNIKEDCEPGHEYTGYMKFVEDDMHKESPVTEVTATAPMEQVEAPVINPNGGAFKGSQSITMTCNTPNALIYYTTDGSDPTPDSKRYTKPFEISDPATVKAIAVKEFMKDSRIVSAKFTLDDSLEARVEKKDLDKVDLDPNLVAVGFPTVSDVTAELSRVLTAHDGYTYQNIAYYDITVMVSNDRKVWRKATLDDFPSDGLTITMSYPKGTTKNGNDFIAAHMFTQTDNRLGIEAGGIEEPTVTKTANGLEFKVRGTSPVAIAWKAAAASNNNTNGTDANGGTNNNGSNVNGNNATDAAANGVRAAANSSNNGAGNNANGNANGTNQSGSNATDTTSASDNTGASSTQGGLSSLLPQTSDGRTILLWVVLAIISAAVIGGIKFKMHH